MTTHKFYSKRTLIDYASVAAKLGEPALVCMDRGVLQIIRKLVTDRAFWDTTYVLTMQEDDYTSPSPAQLESVYEAISHFLDATGDEMTLCEDMIGQLEAIAAALTGAAGTGGCGCGAGGAGATEPPWAPEEPGPPGEQTGDPPEGFSTWAEYETYKCTIATWLVEQVQDDVAWMETVNIVSMAATALAASLLTPIPFDDIVILLGLAITLATEGVWASAIDDMQNAIAADFDELVCALFNASDAEAARDAWVAQIDTSIDAQTGAFYAFIEKAILGSFGGASAVNKLFERDTAIEEREPEGDCEGCWVCYLLDINLGTYVSETEVQSELNVGNNQSYVNVDIHHNQYGFCDDPATLDDVTLDVHDSYPGPWHYEIGTQGSSSDIYNGTSPSFPYANVGHVQVRSVGGDPCDFTADFDIS